MKILKWILVSLVALMVLIIITGPFLVKGYINKNGEELVGRKLYLKGLYHNPFTGYTQLRGFEMYEKNDTAIFISFDTLIVNLDLYRLFSKTLTINEISMVNPFVKVIQQGDEFNFSDIPKHFKKQESEPEPESTDSSSLAIEINNIALINGGTHLLLDQPFYLEDITLHIPGLYFDNRETDADLRFHFQAGGDLQTNTAYNAGNGQFEINIDLSELNLVRGKILQLYSNISGQNGFLSADIDIRGNMKKLSETLVEGELILSKFQVLDQDKVAVVSGDEVRIEIAPTTPLLQKFNIDLVELTKPVIFSEFYADSTSNFSRLAKHSPETDQARSSKDSEIQENPNDSSGLDLTLKEFKIVDGEIKIKDHKPYDKFEYRFFDVDVNSNNIRSDCTTLMSATAKLPEGGNLEALYEGNFLDVTNQSYSISLTISDLTTFSPYTVTLFDYPIEEGQLGITNTTHVNNGYMEGMFVMESSGITLGEHAETNSKYDIPLKLGLWVMEDKDGNIHMEIPVEGDMNDPNTNYINIVLDTFFDQIIQIVNTPFKILGRTVGFDGDLTSMEFNPVQNEITPEIGNSLDQLVKVMETKPELTVALVQHFDAQRAAEQLAIYQVKSDYYRKKNNTKEVQDYFSINDINTENRDFRDYVSKQSKMKVNRAQSLVEACKKIKKRTLAKDTEELADSWDGLVEQYLVDNGISADRFSFQHQSNDKGNFEYQLTSEMADEKELKRAVKDEVR